MRSQAPILHAHSNLFRSIDITSPEGINTVNTEEATSFSPERRSFFSNDRFPSESFDPLLLSPFTSSQSFGL